MPPGRTGFEVNCRAWSGPTCPARLALALRHRAWAPAFGGYGDQTAEWHTGVRGELCRPVQTYRMVCNILVKVGEHQQQFKHSVPMMRFGVARFLFQILDDCERVGEQPFDIGGIHRAPLTAAVEGLVRAEKCVIQEMLEAQLLVCEGRRNRILTRRPSAPSSCSRVHSQSQSPKMEFFPRAVRQRLP